MKYIITIVLTLFLSFESLMAQERINCTIFINGKMPGQGYVTNSYFKFDTARMDFLYLIGEIRLNKNAANLLYSIKDTSCLIMNFTHKDKYDIKHEYEGEIMKEWLAWDYLIIRITTINKKTGEYYFGYNTPEVSKIFLRKEYNPLE